MLTITTWKWGEKYNLDYVRRLSAGLRRHLWQGYQFICVTDDKRVENIPGVTRWPISDHRLTEIRGCYARLRMFDPAWQKSHNIKDRIVCIDLDTVITGPLDALFCRSETFLILQGANSSNPNPFNGSLMMLRPGFHAEVWTDFNLETAAQVPYYDFPDDQGWLWHKLPGASGWESGPHSGVYAFKKPGWPRGDNLPIGARMVAFPGWRDPSRFMDLSWVREHWRV